MPSFVRKECSSKESPVKSSNLIRWSGLAAVVAGLLFMVINLITLLILGFGQERSELLIRSIISPVAGALLLLGLIGLYARQSEATDVIGLISFLFALLGTVLALAGNVWANMLGYLGWALFGVSSLQARVYPRIAAILLIIGALITAPFSTSTVGGFGDILVYMGVGASTVFNVAIIWLGFALFTDKGFATIQAFRTPKRAGKYCKLTTTCLSLQETTSSMTTLQTAESTRRRPMPPIAGGSNPRPAVR